MEEEEVWLSNTAQANLCVLVVSVLENLIWYA